MAKLALSAKITGLLISNLQLSSTTTAKILVKGSEDVKKLVPGFIGQRKHIIKEAQVEIVTPSGDSARITIKENCRLTVQTQEETKSMEFLRRMIRTIQEK